MRPVEFFKVIFQAFKDVVPGFTVGFLSVVLLSCVVFVIQTFLGFTPGVLSVGASVFQSGHIHRLFLYPFYHQTFAQLILNIATLAFLSGSLEKGFGTVRFLHLFLLMSTITGVFYSFLDLLQSDSSQGHCTEGLLPIALACVALTTMHTKTTKGFLCGVSFPTIALPWIFLIITTVLVPHSVLPCNVIAILVGWMCGKKWFSLLELSEARAGVLEKMMPLRFLKSIGGVMFVPASTEERKRTLLPQIKPTPGSYPVQAYAPLSSTNAADTTVNYYEGWPNMTSALSGPVPPLHPPGHSSGFGISHGPGSEQSFGHSYNYSHSHGQL
ncbi:rhomboid domain-containing protein 2 [Xyrichtys novacula]|uniref:Rhomboid domain-containing protein 2 n=1 Tax=Xyrichtys novacula TaxID=13765 RepID=A0AAV1ETC6_XYRNO|nr:rhomboid domain-containing protein 2 [Xyrichtys novacula]